MAPATQAPATAAGPTSHTRFPADNRLPAAAQRLLQLLAQHDQGDGVQLMPIGRGGLWRHTATGKTYARRTFLSLGSLNLVTWDPQTCGLVHVTDAGRAHAAELAKNGRAR